MTDEPASPPCYAAGCDDAYMGYAGREEIVAALNELLEAERAGARVALKAAKEGPEPAYSELMRDVRGDEARWCAMLSRQLKRLETAPSRRTGAFYGKAMAIAEPWERLAFLNRGQSWVVRKLEALTPRVRDEGLHRDLRAMLESHRVNIERAGALLDGRDGR
ncbi:hypothetical protein SAMN02927924_00100 [Sphingobium faniae]|nr:hypothetical protein SAMN02927924_00100 [Sphingobium faniae]